ncbi:MAG: efflux RND transporter periplasmic adaptor subunit [Gemmatales bacterium]|nr:efflux RND transporter periplasmic adaptor subunit [Gemmatales bacterium]MDW7993134.1 efflux RND transporter periplasmic adaptor subunit [Gemmatales bacterium]
MVCARSALGAWLTSTGANLPTGLRQRYGRRTILLGLTVLAYLALTDAHEEEHALASKGIQVENNTILLEHRAWEALAPQLARVERRTLRRMVLGTGQLTVPPNARAVASSWLPGRIEKITVDLGQPIRAGDVVAWVRSAEWEKLITDYFVAQNEAAAARLEAQRIDSLFREALVSRQEWLEAQARRREKENALLITRLQIRALVDDVPRAEALLPVRSPINGHVTRISAKIGEDIDPRRAIVEIVDPSTIWVRAQIPQFYSSLIKPGQNAEVRPRAWKSPEPLRARVLARNCQIDPQSLTETVWLELLDPPASNWHVGMPGMVQIEVARCENVLAIPTAALVQEGMDTYVFVVRTRNTCCHEHETDQENTRTPAPQAYIALERVFFTPGLATPDWVEVRDGLQEGDQVLTIGRHQLAVLLPPRHGGAFRLSPQAWHQYGVRVEPASFQHVRDTISLEASVALAPSQSEQLHCPVTAMLRRWHILTSGHVRQGQVVAEVVSWELQQWQLAWLQSELTAQSQENLVNAYRELIGQGIPLSEQVLRNTELTWRSTRALADGYKSRLRQVGGFSDAELQMLLREHKLVSTLTLTAPRPAWAIPADWPIGQLISPSDALFEMYPATNFQLRARLPEFMSSSPNVDAQARFRPGLAGQPLWMARIFYLEEGRVGEPQRYLWAQLEDAPRDLPMHLQGSLTVELSGPDAPVLAVPSSALWWEGTHAAVFVYHPERDLFEYRPVTVGRTNDLWAEIRSGLKAGEYVATSAVAHLRRHYGRLRSGTGFYCEHCKD